MSTPQGDTNPSWINRIPLIATLLVVVASGILAADATRSVALSTGAVSSPALALLLPLITEGGAVTAGLLAWRRVRAGQGAWPERAALLACIALATAVNASHASGGAWLGVVLAACPPLVLVTSVELLLRNRTATEAEQAAAAERERAERDRIAAERARAEERERRAERARERVTSATKSVSERASLAAVSAPSGTAPSFDERVDQVVEWLAEDPSMSETEIGTRLGVSRATGGRLKRAAKDRLGIEASA